jgi:CheY-like chemotaxis protein
MAHDRQRETILVVDDNLDIRKLARMFLEHFGYTVVTAADGDEGLRIYEERQASIALVLSDVRMPNMNGLELAGRVLGMDSQLPVLLMSGDPGCDYGGLECVVKPFRPAELIEAVSRVLNTKAHSERAASAAYGARRKVDSVASARNGSRGAYNPQSCSAVLTRKTPVPIMPRRQPRPIRNSIASEFRSCVSAPSQSVLLPSAEVCRACSLFAHTGNATNHTRTCWAFGPAFVVTV